MSRIKYTTSDLPTEKWWRRAHPTKIRTARIHELPDTLTDTDIRFAFEYWRGLCAYCGKQSNTLFDPPHLDHYIPVFSPVCPGRVPKNMLPVCAKCNLNKSDTDPIEWLARRFGHRKAEKILREIDAYFSLAVDN